MRVILLQLAGVWAAGCCAVLAGSWTFLLAAFLGLPLFALPGAVLVFSLVYLVGMLTPDGAPLSGRPWPRAVWAAIITVLGCGASVLAYAVLNSVQADNNVVLNVLLLALPFSLVAATLTANWLARIVAALLLAVLVWLGVQLPGAGSSFTAFWHSLFSS
ncbi:hypothetical protein [Amycolatopsis taiwanensis]|uniref:Uncharacterized protein n=1 Tax=Amycolatopsis taiwanensis TaxID=342230 RepID=A0A9W6R2W8_9PSEU|nr:hypothetical protein [Amycolatopsis taiwanensis]GLY68268.1 hypothetical protein Atai01_48870 [Amycolatopsis taiwanensis]